MEVSPHAPFAGGAAWRVLLGLASLVVIVIGVRALSPVLTPVIFSIFLTVLTQPLVRKLHVWGLPWQLAALAVAVTVLVVIGVLVFFIFTSLLEFRDKLPEYRAEWEERTAQYSDDAGDADIPGSGQLSAETAGSLESLALSVTNRILEATSFFFLVFTLTLFITTEINVYTSKLRAASAETEGRLRRQIREVIPGMQHYFGIKAVENAVIAAFFGVLLWILSVDFPVLWAILAFFLCFVPNVGLIIALIPPTILGFIDEGLTTAIIIVVGMTAINWVGDNVVLPRVTRSQLNMPLAVQWSALIFWAWVLGPIGALLAIPLTIVLRALVSLSRDSDWAANWLEGPPKQQQQVAFPATGAGSPSPPEVVQ